MQRHNGNIGPTHTFGRAHKDSYGGETMATFMDSRVRQGRTCVAGRMARTQECAESVAFGAAGTALHEAVLVATETRLRACLQALPAGVLESARDASGRTCVQSAAWNGKALALRAIAAHALAAQPSLFFAPWRGADGGAVRAEVAPRSGLEVPAPRCGLTLEFDEAPPLLLAAARGHADCVRVLHELGGSLLLKDARGRLAAHYAAAAGSVACLQLLHELGLGTRSGVAGVVSQLIQRDGAEETPAHHAARYGQPEALRCLKHLAQAQLGAKGEGGATPAHRAAAAGHVQCLHVLHQEGALLNVGDHSGMLAAHWAARAGHAAVLRALYELGCADSLRSRDRDGLTAAHWAARSGQAGCLRTLHELLSGSGRQVFGMPDTQGRTAAAHAASEGPSSRRPPGRIASCHARQMLVICSPLCGHSGTVELTLPSQKSARSGRFRRFLITKICCFLWHVGTAAPRSLNALRIPTARILAAREVESRKTTPPGARTWLKSKSRSDVRRRARGLRRVVARAREPLSGHVPPRARRCRRHERRGLGLLLRAGRAARAVGGARTPLGRLASPQQREAEL